MTINTIHGNSQFQKPSSLRWTWESTGGGYHTEISHIIVTMFCLRDLAVVPKFYTGWDHLELFLRKTLLHTERRESREDHKAKSQKHYHYRLEALRFVCRPLEGYRHRQRQM
ncbi:hypothetical protein NECAME_11961 [Necator americanus]|uniref:Uncharacterized protein n=1 Tax=Necator americanus TaxID=51031 RepID=W2T3A7_NECAM|nr:hypothetical protein NECAME_11961 [Necator americanus]ETN76044.1 hypothetical protein NECAME_11961 [Necator americanus]